jgi:phosphoenolpyruvate synthase/pyruvate phosphate dikinase
MFPAEKVSGALGSIFALSSVLEVIRQGRIQNKFKFPFYAFSIDAVTSKGDEWIDEEKYNKVVEDILRSLQNNGLSYFEKIQGDITKEASDFLVYSSGVIAKIGSLGDSDLLEQYRAFTARYLPSFGMGAVTFIYEDILSARLHKALEARSKQVSDELEYLLKTDYKSFMVESEDALREIKNASSEGLKNNLIEEYKNSFFFMKAGFDEAPILSSSDISNRADAVLESHKKEASVFSSKLTLSAQEKDIISLLKVTEAIHDQRKKINLIGDYTLFRFIDEVVKRKNLDREIAKRAFWTEFGELLMRPETLLKKLENRTYASFVLIEDEYLYLDYMALTHKKAMDIGVCKGTPASKGKVTGRAHIIFGPTEFDQFKDGEILLTEMTRPDFVPIMRMAKAIVTDEGGLMCHAAIVSRELRIPCIVGTRTVTRLFKTGDMIEVDAEKGIVKLLN